MTGGIVYTGRHLASLEGEMAEGLRRDAVLAVNLTGTFDVTRLSIPFLRQSGSGVIINMSSVGGRFGYPNRSPYATTKRGLLGLTETLALELGGAGIRGDAIASGAVDVERIQTGTAKQGRDHRTQCWKRPPPTP
ncbi:SDR family NAD(P)-dependent oxidoreductase [Streptomyces laculatispora]|nr:SDR family NAD(P)-dependent oxidoreductase [Streptomyces laculatispora]